MTEKDRNCKEGTKEGRKKTDRQKVSQNKNEAETDRQTHICERH